MFLHHNLALPDWYTNYFLQLTIVSLEHIELILFVLKKGWKRGDEQGRKKKGGKNAFMMLVLLLTSSFFRFPSFYDKSWALKWNFIDLGAEVERVCFWIWKQNMEASHIEHNRNIIICYVRNMMEKTADSRISNIFSFLLSKTLKN